MAMTYWPSHDYSPEQMRNFCRLCGRDFSSVQNFDAHQLGKGQQHRWSPEHEDGFRCMNDEELGQAGFELNEHGRWHRPRAADIRILAA
jgi:hypothetical protein